MALNAIKYFGISLPIDRDRNSKYFKLNTTPLDEALTSLKLLLLTNKKERLLNTDYGVGIDNLVFENDVQYIKNTLKSEIKKQVIIYLPYILINDINVQSWIDLDPSDQAIYTKNTFLIKINFSLKLQPTEEKTLEVNLEF